MLPCFVNEGGKERVPATASGVTCIRVYTYIIAHTFSFLFCGREKPCLSSVTAGQEKETERLRRAD